MKIIDCHTHCFPDFLASAAMPKLAATSGIKPCHDGTLSSLKKLMSDCGISASVVCNIATNPRQQVNVNRFAVSINGDGIISLGSVNPDCEDVFAAVKEIKDSGLYGIKLHPDYMGYFINDEKFDRIFAACSALDVPVVTHAGYDPQSPDLFHCTPDMMSEIIGRYPDLRLVAAHSGGQKVHDEVLDKLAGKNIWFDLSMLCYADRAKVRRIILCHDPDKLFFGSDAPWGEPAAQWRIIEEMNLGSELTEKIAHINAEKFYKL